MSKKSQMEILGLAVVIVLIVLGFLLYMMFGIKSGDASEETEEFADPKMASSMLNAMLKTTIKCQNKNNYTLAELYQDCYEWEMISCEGQDSCEFAESKTEKMLNSTLQEWGKGYWFEATTGSAKEITLNSLGCTKLSRQRKPAHQPVPIMSGTLNISLGICD